MCLHLCVCVCFSSFSLFNTRLCWLDWFSFPSQYGLKNTECFQFNEAGGNRKWNSCSEDWPNLQHTRKANIYGFPRRPAHSCISKCSGLRGFVSQPGTNKSQLNSFFPCVILKHSLLGLPLLSRLLCTLIKKRSVELFVLLSGCGAMRPSSLWYTCQAQI